MYSIHNTVDIIKIHKGYSMHAMFLLALLCCHSLDIVAMEMDNEGITQLPENFAVTTLTDDCVGSRQGCIFNQYSNNPVAYLSTLMFLQQEEKSEENMVNLQHIQDLLQANILRENLADTQDIEAFGQAFGVFLSSLFDQKITPETKLLQVPEKATQYACKGHIQLIKSRVLYIAYFMKNKNDPFQLRTLQKAGLDTNIIYHTQNNLKDKKVVFNYVYNHGLGELGNMAKSVLDLLGPQSIVTIIDPNQLGPEFREAAI